MHCLNWDCWVICVVSHCQNLVHKHYTKWQYSFLYLLARIILLKYCFLNLFIFNLRIIALQYCVGFAIHQHELATGMHMSPPFRTSLPSPSLRPPHHSTSLSLSQSTGLSSLHHTAYSQWLSALHMVIYMFQCYSLNSFSPLLSSLCLTSLFSMFASLLLLYK